MPTEGRTRPKIPLFEQFSLEQVSDLTGYSIPYLEDLRNGSQQLRPRFRKVVARMLGKPEQELFSEHGANANGVAIGEHPNNGGAS